MKKLREEALAHQKDMVSMQAWSEVLVSDEESNVYHFTLSFFGPCCPNGCQYCRPNCHEQFDSSNYF